MKVCTDSCLFGAWIAEIISKTKMPENILDIGTGTGLLSLMVAQKNDSSVTGVEIDENAFKQACDNFSLSPWNKRLEAIQGDIKSFQPGKPFDWIISNPPFFENDLKSIHTSKNLAKHHEGLLLKDLVNVVSTLLKKEGKFALLVPFHRVDEVIALAGGNSFFMQEKVLVKQTPAHSFFRGMLLFGREKTETINREIIIKNKEGMYTPEFMTLLKDYYLE